jgi:hypothetical protein
VQDLDYIVGCVCHECYHAFQNTLRQNGWKEWHWELLGITRGTVEELINVRRHKYYSNTKTKQYRVQMVEVEARTFATNCKNEAATTWGALTLEE